MSETDVFMLGLTILTCISLTLTTYQIHKQEDLATSLYNEQLKSQLYKEKWLNTTSELAYKSYALNNCEHTINKYNLVSYDCFIDYSGVQKCL